jgi:hypothetical protein
MIVIDCQHKECADLARFIMEFYILVDKVKPGWRSSAFKVSWLLKTIVKRHYTFCFVGELVMNNAGK